MNTVPSFKVSVIIPVYNAEITVQRAVASALDQPEVGEVILVEDASPDASLALCRRWVAGNPGKIRLLQHPDGGNHGAGPSRNLGIKAATLPFIAFLDADDYYLPGRFQRDADLLMADGSLDGVYNALGTDFQDPVGRQWYDRSGRPLLTTLDPPPDPRQLFSCMSPIGTDGYFSLDTLTIRRHVFETMSGFADLRLAQDTLFCIQLAARYRLAGGQTRQPVAMRGVHARNRIQDSSRARDTLETLFAALEQWRVTADLPDGKQIAIDQARIQLCRHWIDILQHLRLHPAILTRGGTWSRLMRWTLIRQFPDDPLLPGLRASRWTPPRQSDRTDRA